MVLEMYQETPPLPFHQKTREKAVRAYDDSMGYLVASTRIEILRIFARNRMAETLVSETLRAKPVDFMMYSSC